MAKILYTDYSSVKTNLTDAVTNTGIGGSYSWTTFSAGSKLQASQISELRNNISTAWDLVNTGYSAQDNTYNSANDSTVNGTYKSPNCSTGNSTVYSSKNSTVNSSKNTT